MVEAGQCGKVLIICIPNSRSFFRYAVTISNSQNQPIFQGYTTANGSVEFEVDELDEYQIKIRSNDCLSPRAAYRWVTLCPHRKSIIYFKFKAIDSSHRLAKCKFDLTDQNYHGLPISKGEIYLWQVPM